MSDAIPLPPHPDLSQYHDQAEDLLQACRSNDVRAWAERWTQSWPAPADRIERHVRDAHIAELADAQLFLARAHGFASWPKFVEHIESPDANFEAAVDAIIEGDLETLARLLREDPSLVERRSNREHRSTLLHYVSANGVEDFRQKTPPNIVAIATLLLDSDADVNAESDAYAGHSTTLGLVATSVHPQRAGVQRELMELLLARGARIDDDAVKACLANGQPDAAAFLANLGAQIDLIGAAGLGSLAIARQLLNDGADPRMTYGGYSALSYAVHYEHPDVAQLLTEAMTRRNAPDNAR